MSGSKQGIVKFFNKEKGFGFIKEDGSGTEYFVHASGLKDDIREKDEVTFNTKQGKKGINAIDVEVAE